MRAAVILSLPLLFSAGAASSRHGAATLDIAHLSGRWTVTGVATGGGIQALATDDPAYMKRVVDIGRNRLVWVGPSDSIGGATVTDRCDGPLLRPLAGRRATQRVKFYAAALAKLRAATATPYAVQCKGGGTWGPDALHGANFYAGPGGALIMTWYDGGVLRLERTGRR